MDTVSGKMIDIRDGLSVDIRKILSFIAEDYPPHDRFRRSLIVTQQIEEKYGINADDCYEMIVDMVHNKGHMYLIEGHGNFGYFPAAPNHSECRSSTLLQYISDRQPLSDISAPVDIPLPYILIGGTPGYYSIQSKIPPHNFVSVMEAVFRLIMEPDVTNEELARIVNGPELQIGGTIINTDELPEIYERGFGEIRYSISRKSLNPDCWDGIKYTCKTYCDWYGHKLIKPEGAKKGYYEITVAYNALLTNGQETRYFTLKEILQEFIKHYSDMASKRSVSVPDAKTLCELLLGEVEYLTRWKGREEYDKLQSIFQELLKDKNCTDTSLTK